ncbi:DUF2490 domain-containing protein [Carboxylicivirga taeanensis]|uniref:DUF2490 domain-containing protein n=1 Tax=Carboxylicivirga taeanensis TaxID=1416875 RepID=UPI003F6DF1FF
MRKIFVLLCISLTSVIAIKSQQQYDFNLFNGAGELRTIYVQRHRLNELYALNLDAGSYIGLGEKVWTRWGFRGAIQRSLSDLFKADIGFMYNRVKFPEPIRSDEPTSNKYIRHEYRPHQSVSVSYPRFKASALKHRLRLEERIFHDEFKDETVFKMRLRYRLQHQARFDGQPIAPKSLYYNTSAEFNFNIYQEAKDVFWVRGRYNLGLGYQFNSKLSGDLNYFFEHNKTAKGQDQAILHIFQINLRQTIYWM